jgi:K+-transporting ATPase KdpF subunit
MCAVAIAFRRPAMEYIVAAIVAAAIGAYLIYALLRPERF